MFEISVAINQTLLMVSGMNSTASQNIASKLFAVIDSKSRAAILANIASHYGISSEDAFAEVTDKDAAIMTREIAKKEGIFVGNSAGSAMAGLMQLKDNFKEGETVVVIFHDHGTRYLGKMFNDDWMRDRGFLEIKKPKAIDLISSHKNQKLLTVEANASVSDALTTMN